jgi:hypothetical protein
MNASGIMHLQNARTFLTEIAPAGITMAIQLDSEFEARLRHLAQVHQTSPEAILREAAEQYLGREKKLEQAVSKQHPSGRPWPRRTPVGGIITPV